MRYFLNGQFKTDQLEEFFAYANSKEDITIYLESPGGEVSAGEIILDAINSEPKRYHLIGVGCIESVAFELFFKAQCSRSLLPGCVGMYHQSRMTFVLNERLLSKNLEHDVCMRQYMQDYAFTNTMGLAKELGFNKEELMLLEKGEDVWLDHNRMQELLINGEKKRERERIKKLQELPVKPSEAFVQLREAVSQIEVPELTHLKSKNEKE